MRHVACYYQRGVVRRVPFVVVFSNVGDPCVSDVGAHDGRRASGGQAGVGGGAYAREQIEERRTLVAVYFVENGALFDAPVLLPQSKMRHAVGLDLQCDVQSVRRQVEEKRRV